MGKRLKHRIKKIIKWTLGILLALIILVPVSLYIPWVQNRVKDLACSYVKKKTGMDLKIGKILIKFPLDLSLDDMTLLDEHGDTMIVAKNFTANVALKPLLKMRLEIDGAELTDAKYRLVSGDASMVMKADVRHCKLKGADIDLKHNTINLLDGELTGGKIMLALYPHKSIDDGDTTKAAPWRIQAHRLVLNDVDYVMTVEPSIHKMETHLARAELRDGHLDTKQHTIDVKSLAVDNVDCKYVYPNETWVAAFEREHPLHAQRPIPPETVDTVPWTIRSQEVSMKGGHIIYAERGKTPSSGLDMSYIELSDVNFTVNDFYSRGSILRVPLKELRAKERGGLEITQAQGTASISDQNILVKNFNINTRGSSINVDGAINMSTLNDPPSGSMRLTANTSIDLREIKTVMPSVKEVTDFIPSNHPVKLNATLEGNTRDLDISNGSIELPGFVKANLDGNIKNVNNAKKLTADINIDADINNMDFAKKKLLDSNMQSQVNIVPMKLKGNLKYAPENLAANIDMRLKSGGSLTGKGSYNLSNNSYSVDATASALPVKKIMPQLDVNNLTAHVKASGHGFDFLEKNTSIDAQVELTDIDYGGKHYRNYDADVKLNGNNFDAKVTARNRGSLTAKGSFDPKTQKYDIDANANSFPVDELAPQLGMGTLTAHIRAKGEKFDFLNPSSSINADIDLGSVVYNNQSLKDLKGNITLGGNHIKGNINSTNPNCDLYAEIDGTINGDTYHINSLKGNIRDLDLKALKLMDSPCNGSGEIFLKGDFNPKANSFNGSLQLSDLNWNLNGEPLVADSAKLDFNINNHSTVASFSEGTNDLNFSAPHSINDLMKHFDNCANIVQKQYKKINLDANEMVDALPQFSLDLNMGPNGLIQRLLGKQEIDFRDFHANIGKDSVLHAEVTGNNMSYGTNAIDKLSLNVQQVNDSISIKGTMDNEKGTWDEFAHVNVEGSLIGSNVKLLVKQQNIDNEMGYHIGVDATIQDSIINAKIMPKNPVIAYRDWNINDANFVKIDFGDKRLEANLTLKSDSSSITLKTDPARLVGTQNIEAEIKNVKIEEWTNMLPFLEPMTGVLNADLEVKYDGTNVEGNGEVELLNFTYNNWHEGNLKLKTDLTIDPATSSTNVNADLIIDGSTVALAYGALNDQSSSSPFNLKVDLYKFPLRKISPFILGRTIMLDGFVNGQLTVDNSIENPIVNGHLVSDTAFVKLPRYGSSLRLSEQSININNNVIDFVNYKIYGLNNNIVNLNGNVDFQSLDDIKINLALKGKNVQFIGSEQRQFSEIFGNGFIDIDGTFRSEKNLTAINANAKLLPGSDITYVLKDDINSIVNNSATEGMVTFINPTDTTLYNTTIITGGTSSSATNILVNIDIENGAKINAFLQPEGKDRFSLNGTGKLRYLLDFAGKEDLTGTYNITSGVVRYTPPVISQKVFNLTEGSSLTWSGEMLNPQLNLRATNSVRTSVTNTDGNGSRLVDFDIIAKLQNTLSNLDLKFDLEAKNDATVEGELQTMTETQRAQAAINLLLYNSYSGSTPTGDFSTTGALFSFLQSQINSWTSSNLKGVDLSFGINQFEGSLDKGGRLETSYSYRLSKSLFGERIKIAVGGEYSTEASHEQNFSENLINDISFEYLLNNTGTRYLTLFRHKGLESVLEGEVTVTGISFVMKHKLSSLKDLFKWLKKSPKKTEEDEKVEQDKKVELIIDANDTNTINTELKSSSQ